MTHKLKSLFTGPRSLESRLTSALESRSRDLAGSAPTQPFELVELAAEEVAGHVHLAGRGPLCVSVQQRDHHVCRGHV
jgi:hypothetical protein